MVIRKALQCFVFGFVALLIFSMILLPSCGEKTPLPTPYFPVQAEVQTMGLDALWYGEMVLDGNRYLRVRDTLILWPYGYTLEMEDCNI